MQLLPNQDSAPDYFQVLLEATVNNYVPGNVSFVAARILSEQNLSG